MQGPALKRRRCDERVPEGMGESNGEPVPNRRLTRDCEYLCKE